MTSKDSEELKFSPSILEPAQCRAEISQFQSENAALRNEVLSLTSEVYGAKLAAKYLDKELAGRIQQLQLLGEFIYKKINRSVIKFIITTIQS